MKKKRQILILAIVLIMLSFGYILLFGNTYTFSITNATDIHIEQDKEVIKIEEEKKGNTTIIKVKSVSRGKAYVIAQTSEDTYNSNVFYVHKFGIITDNSYFGDATGDEVIPISVSIILIAILSYLIRKYRISLKSNLYQYKNISYLGLIIFMFSCLLEQIISTFNYRGLNDTVNFILNTANSFSIIIFPIALITSLLIIISNIILIKKEGFSFKNILGFLLSLFLCFFTIFPELLSNYLYSHPTFVNVHDLNGIWHYIEVLFESLTYVILSYLECILLATIVLSIKAARRIPEFNKDYIIILGCMIKKDGSLTKLLKSRVDRAIEFSLMQKDSTGKNIKFIPSGGKGKNEVVAEGVAIKNYLVEQGIEEKDILVEDKSTTTLENLKFSNKLISNKKANIAFSTTNFHVFRAGVIGSSLGLKLEGIGSTTRSYFWINAFIREFVANLYSENKKHMIVIILLILAIIAMVAISYVSNQL